MTPPGQDHNPSQVSSQQKLVLIYTAELTGASQAKCLTQGHTTQWLGQGLNPPSLGYELDMLTTGPLCRSV